MTTENTTRRDILKRIPNYLTVAAFTSALSSPAAAAQSASISGAIAPAAQADKNLAILSIRDFGAKGDGSDDSAGITAAIAQAKKLRGARIMLEPGAVYKFSAPISITGDFGQGLEIIGQNSTLQATHNGPCVSIGNYAQPASEYRIKFRMSGIAINGPGPKVESSVGVLIQECADVFLADCLIRAANIGLKLSGGLICNFDNLTIRDNAIGVHARATSHFACNSNTFNSCRIINNSLSALNYHDFPNSVVMFVGCEIEGNNANGTNGDGVRVCEFINAGELNLIGCHFEANKGEFGLYFSGASNAKTLNLIGCEMIQETANVMFVQSGAFNVIGGRIWNGRAKNNILLDSGVSGFVSGCDTTLSGNTQNCVVIKDGRLNVGGLDVVSAIGELNKDVALLKSRSLGK